MQTLYSLIMPVEAVMFWNEPNNKSHWDFEIDPEWEMFAAMVKAAAEAVTAANPALIRVLGGISPIDPRFIQRLTKKGAIAALDAIAALGVSLHLAAGWGAGVGERRPDCA